MHEHTKVSVPVRGANEKYLLVGIILWAIVSVPVRGANEKMENIVYEVQISKCFCPRKGRE